MISQKGRPTKQTKTIDLSINVTGQKTLFFWTFCTHFILLFKKCNSLIDHSIQFKPWVISTVIWKCSDTFNDTFIHSTPFSWLDYICFMYIVFLKQLRKYLYKKMKPKPTINFKYLILLLNLRIKSNIFRFAYLHVMNVYVSQHPIKWTWIKLKSNGSTKKRRKLEN